MPRLDSFANKLRMHIYSVHRTILRLSEGFQKSRIFNRLGEARPSLTKSGFCAFELISTEACLVWLAPHGRDGLGGRVEEEE
jgi:hypothetical protein